MPIVTVVPFDLKTLHRSLHATWSDRSSEIASITDVIDRDANELDQGHVMIIDHEHGHTKLWEIQSLNPSWFKDLTYLPQCDIENIELILHSYCNIWYLNSSSSDNCWAASKCRRAQFDGPKKARCLSYNNQKQGLN